MNYYFIVYADIKKVIIEYCNSIMKKITNSKLIDFPSEEFFKLTPADFEKNKFIFFGIHYTNYPKIYSHNIYYINLEQLTMNGKNTFRNMLSPLLNFCNIFTVYKLFDYSEGNIAILEENNIKSNYLPYQVNYDEIYNYEKTKDFVICCTWNERIAKIYYEIATKNQNCFSIGNPILWGEQRDEILFRSKVLANVHYMQKDYNILEEIRITRCILNKVIVVSEYAHKYEKYPLKDFVVFVNYDEMINKIQEILNNYEEYHNNFFKNFDLEKIDAELKTFIDKNLLNI
jgi:hypothetical protein